MGWGGRAEAPLKPSLRGSENLTNTFQTVSKRDSALSVIVNSLLLETAQQQLYPVAKVSQSKIEKVFYWKDQTESTKSGLVSKVYHSINFCFRFCLNVKQGNKLSKLSNLLQSIALTIGATGTGL